MSEIEPLSHELVARSLKGQGLNYLRTPDDRFKLEYRPDEASGATLTAWLWVEGPNQDILDIWVVADKRFPRSEWGRMIMLCNQWNNEKRWPKAYLATRGLPDTATDTGVVLELQLKLSSGLQIESIDEWYNMVVGGAYQFWRWIKEQSQPAS